MRTAITRAQHQRAALGFPGDLTAAEWTVLEPLLPASSPVGCPPCWPMREILDALYCILRGGFRGECCLTATGPHHRSAAAARPFPVSEEVV